MNGTPHAQTGRQTSSVYISGALRSRSNRPVAAAKLKRAMQSMATAMATEPSTMLPRFVAQAMDLTGAAAAGLSVHEAEPGPGVFRWRHLHGALAEHDGLVAPGDASPSAVTLKDDAATLASHPERIYDWMASRALVLPEMLLVPLHVPKQGSIGTLWVVADDAGKFQQGHADALTELAAFAGAAMQMIQKAEALRDALDEQELIASEMNHRLKNLFAMTQGMIHGSARRAENIDEMAGALSGRLQALAKAHSLVQGRVSAIGEAPQADLGGLIGSIVGAQGSGAETSRVGMDGCDVSCGPHSVNAIALVMNELATNAAKYGALSTEAGAVEISWSRHGEWIVLVWREMGGPVIAAAPGGTGFGSSLIARTVERQLRGDVVYDWLPEGVAVTFRIPEANLAR